MAHWLSMRLSPAFALLAIIVGGCTTPYSPYPQVEEVSPSGAPLASRPFPGIMQIMEDASKNGQKLHIFWTHGMCTFNADYARKSFAELATALGGTWQERPKPPISFPDSLAYEVRGNLVAPYGTAATAFLIWSPLTTPYKRILLPDNPVSTPYGEFPYRRALLNGDLKTSLLNDCLIDAVVYSGRNGDPIRSAMLSSICNLFGGRVISTEDQQQCQLDEAGPSYPIVIITESLGSKMVFDALDKMWSDAARSRQARAALERHLLNVRIMFMAANQIPLLDQANPIPGGANVAHSSMAQFFKNLSGAEAEYPSLAPEQRVFVAFTDPNDLLTYRLVPADYNFDKLNVRVTNVIVSNDRTYLGLVENPYPAHTAYIQNPEVMRIMTYGYNYPMNEGAHP